MRIVARNQTSLTIEEKISFCKHLMETRLCRLEFVHEGEIVILDSCKKCFLYEEEFFNVNGFILCSASAKFHLKKLMNKRLGSDIFEIVM